MRANFTVDYTAFIWSVGLSANKNSDFSGTLGFIIIPYTIIIIIVSILGLSCNYDFA